MKSRREGPGFPEDMPAGLPGPQSATNTVRRMPAAGPQQVFFHLDFVRSLQMHRKMATWIFVTAVVLSLGYMAKRWNTYKADALVYVQPSPHKVIENGPGQQWPYDANTYESYIQQQVHDITRPDVLAGAVKRIPGWQGSGESEQSAADRLGSAIEVTRLGSAYEVQIESTASTAQEAAQIANAVASSYIESATREQRSGDPQRIELQREERDRILKELASDRAEQEELSRKLGVASVTGTTPDPIDDQIAQTRAELVKARTASDEAEAKLTALAGSKTSHAAIEAEAEELVAGDPGLVSMKTALNKRRSDLISQMANLTPNHPQYKQNAEELAKINTSLETMSAELRSKASAQIQQKLKNELERTSSVEAHLNGQLAQLTGAAGTAAPRMQRLNELGADIQRLQNRFSVVDEQYRNLTMENSSPGAVYLASAALPPLHAARAKVLRNCAILMLAGLVFAVGAALLAHNLDPRVYIAQDVERVLGFPPMAQLPDLYEVGAGVAEEYMLRVAAAVEHAHQQGLLSSCIFTGVATGAGVTTVSTRVSSMLEAMGRETVLVDAASAPQAPASNPTTDLVHAPRGSRSTALLQQMSEETNGDSVVVTDTAPLLVSGETEYLARFVDSAIVVIESGVTTKAQLREVAQTLQRLEVSSVGFILNRISLKNASPAFRQSVHAVESHLRAQARPVDRPASAPERMESTPAAAAQPQNFEPPWNVAPEAEEQTEATPKSAPQDATVYAAAPPAPAVAPSPVADAPIEAPVYATAPEPVEDRAAVRVEDRASKRISVRADEQETVVVPVPVEAAVIDTFEPVDIPSIAAPAIVAHEQPEPSASRMATRSHVARPMRGREAVRLTPAAETRPVVAQDVAEPVAPAFIPSTPARRFEDLAASTAARISEFAEVKPEAPARWTDDVAPAAAPEPPPEVPEPVAETALVYANHEVDPDDVPYSAASRLGGLRSLMTSLGIKNLHKEWELRKTQPEPETVAERPIERPIERPVFAQPETPAELSTGRADVPVREVTARPEIIPPHAVVETVERESPSTRSVKSPRVNRWDSADDIETLPSKRGQYRKRH